MDSLYERLNKYFKNNDGIKDYNLFGVGEDGLVYKDVDNYIKLTKKDKKLKSIKNLGFENVTSKSRAKLLKTNFYKQNILLVHCTMGTN